jgi:hypothetical protein
LEIRQLFVEMENVASKLGLQINQGKIKYMKAERKNILKQSKIGHLKIKNYKFETVENLKYLQIPNEDNNHQILIQERVKNANKTYKIFFKQKHIQK